MGKALVQRIAEEMIDELDLKLTDGAMSLELFGRKVCQKAWTKIFYLHPSAVLRIAYSGIGNKRLDFQGQMQNREVGDRTPLFEVDLNFGQEIRRDDIPDGETVVRLVACATLVGRMYDILRGGSGIKEKDGDVDWGDEPEAVD